MTDFEEKLRGLAPRKAQGEILERAKRGAPAAPRFRFPREAVLAAAAALLFGVLIYTIAGKPAPTVQPTRVQDPEWIDHEVKADELPADEEARLRTLIIGFQSDDLGRRDASSEALSKEMDLAIGLLRAASHSDDPETRVRSKQIVDAWTRRRAVFRVSDYVAKARKEGQPKDEWKPIAEKAAAGDAESIQRSFAAGWQIAPLIADVGGNLGVVGQSKARGLLRSLVAPLFETRTGVKLTKRTKDEYGTSAYSFRGPTQDIAVHHNAVDLLLGGCGQLHVNPHRAIANRIIDVGDADLVDVREAPTGAWRRESITPVKGHVYVLEMGMASMATAAGNASGVLIKLRIRDVRPDAVEFEWSLLSEKKVNLANPTRKDLAVMATCDKEHEEK